jgi:hypothetical protein
LCCCKKIPDINNLREERLFQFIVSEVRPIILGSIDPGPEVRQNIMAARATCFIVDRKQREKGPGTKYNPQSHAPVTMFSSQAPLLKSASPPKIALPAGSSVQHISL